MDLSSLFHKDNIMPSLASGEHLEVIEEMVNFLSEKGLLKGLSPEDALQALRCGNTSCLFREPF